MKEIYSLDTSILVRLVTHDNFGLAKKAAELLKRCDINFSISPAALTELVYVLQSQYNYSRSDIALSALALFEDDHILFDRFFLVAVLKLYIIHPKLSYVDCCLVAQAHQAPKVTTLWTFDHKLAAQCEIARELK